MVAQDRVLVMLLTLVERIPAPAAAPGRQRGHPVVYSDRLFLKALVLMIVRRLANVHELLSVLAEPTAEMQTLRGLLMEQGRFPGRRTFERRLAAVPATLPAQISCLGRHLVGVLDPGAQDARAAAIDSTVLRAKGGVWHKKDREAGVVPHSSIDTQARWTKSGWHGWVYGWKLHLVCAAGAVWLPLAARLTTASEADNTVAPALIAPLPEDLRFLLGDQHYRDPALDDLCTRRSCVLVTPTRGRYPHHDAGKEVRRLLHKTRSLTIETFNEQFKGMFEGHQAVPTKGVVATQRFALGAVFVYQLSLLHRHAHGADLRVGLKAFLRAA
jgi:Transposase DDE domain